MTNLEQKQNGWLELMREWIKAASNLKKTARDSNLFLKKAAAEQVFGSNLVLATARRASARRAALISPHKISGRHFVPPTNSSVKNRKV